MMLTNPHNHATVHKSRRLVLVAGIVLSLTVPALSGLKAQASAPPDPSTLVPDSVFIHSDGTVEYMDVGQHDDEGIVDNSNAMTEEQREAIAFVHEVNEKIMEQLKVIEEQVAAMQALKAVNDLSDGGNTGGDDQPGESNTGGDEQQAEVNVPPLELDIGSNTTLHQNIFDTWRGEGETALCDIRFTFKLDGVEYVATVPRGADLSTLPGGSNYTLGNNCEGILYLLQEAGATYSPVFMPGTGIYVGSSDTGGAVIQGGLFSNSANTGGAVFEGGNDITLKFFNLSPDIDYTFAGYDEDGTMLLRHRETGEIIKHYVSQNGGAIAQNWGGNDITNAQFVNNTALIPALIQGVLFSDSANTGGAVFKGGNDITNVQFVNNTAPIQGGLFSNSANTGGAVFEGGNEFTSKIINLSPSIDYEFVGYDEDGMMLLRDIETAEIIKYSGSQIGGAINLGGAVFIQNGN